MELLACSFEGHADQARDDMVLYRMHLFIWQHH